MLLPAVVYVGADVDGCTTITIGRNATTDGSVMASHADDCSVCDWRMVYVPARDHPQGAMRKIFDGTWLQYPRIIDPARAPAYTGGAGINETKITGSIPEVLHTYAIWESAYGLMNEHGLAIGESTCSANLVGVGVLNGGDALFTIRELIAVALERCASARCAIQTMGDLAARYGFFGEETEKGGAGEALTIADKIGEAWVFHITGGVPRAPNATGPDRWAGRRGAIWGAQRVPDDHVAIVANNFIIREVNPADPNNFMVHPGLFELTKEAGLWSGTGTFDWLRIMAPDIRTFSYLPGFPPIPMYTAIRMWWVFKQVAPSRNIGITTDVYEYPFSVPVDKQLTALDMMDLFRSHYEGTEFDMRLGALAGPWQSPNRAEGGLGMHGVPGEFARGTSIFRTSYTQVGQTGPTTEPVLWFGPDASTSSVFVPFFARVLGPNGGGKFDEPSFGEGSMKELSFTNGTPPAWWAFNFVANWMEHSYKNMSESYVYPKRDQLQEEVAAKTFEAIKSIAGKPDDEAAQLLADLQTDVQRNVTEEWWKFAALLVVRYSDYVLNFPEWDPTNVHQIGYPAFWLEMIGFSKESFYPTWFQRTQAVPQLLTAPERALALLSAGFGFTRGPSTTTLASIVPVGSTLGVPIALAVVFVGGVVLGRHMERQGAKREVARGSYVQADW